MRMAEWSERRSAECSARKRWSRLITQGDGLPEPDHPVTADELLGTVVQVSRRGKPVRHAPRSGWPARLATAVFRQSALAGRVFTRVQGLPERAGL